jgi:hypothetical protein
MKQALTWISSKARVGIPMLGQESRLTHAARQLGCTQIWRMSLCVCPGPLLTCPSSRNLRTALQCLSHSAVLRSTAIRRASTLRLADTTTRSSTGSCEHDQDKSAQKGTDYHN